MWRRVASLKQSMCFLQKQIPSNNKIRHEHMNKLITWLNSKNDLDLVKSTEFIRVYENILKNERSLDFDEKIHLIDIREIYKYTFNMDIYLENRYCLNNSSSYNNSTVSNKVLVPLSSSKAQSIHPEILLGVTFDGKIPLCAHLTTADNSLELLTANTRLNEQIHLINISNFLNIYPQALLFIKQIFPNNIREDNTWFCGKIGNDNLLKVGITSKGKTQYVSKIKFLPNDSILPSRAIEIDDFIVKKVIINFNKESTLNCFTEQLSSYLNVEKSDLIKINFLWKDHMVLWHSCILQSNNNFAEALNNFTHILSYRHNLIINNINENISYESMSDEMKDKLYKIDESISDQIKLNALSNNKSIYNNVDLYKAGKFIGESEYFFVDVPLHLKNIEHLMINE